MSGSIFTKIINRELPAAFIYEDERVIAIPDKFPSMEGQVLVIPKQEVSYIFDLDDELYTHLWSVSKKISKALDKAFQTERTCVVVEGFEVPHVHIRLYPCPTPRLVLSPRAEKSDEDLAAVAEKVRSHLAP